MLSQKILSVKVELFPELGSFTWSTRCAFSPSATILSIGWLMRFLSVIIIKIIRRIVTSAISLNIWNGWWHPSKTAVFSPKITFHQKRPSNVVVLQVFLESCCQNKWVSLIPSFEWFSPIFHWMLTMRIKYVCKRSSLLCISSHSSSHFVQPFTHLFLQRVILIWCWWFDSYKAWSCPVRKSEKNIFFSLNLYSWSKWVAWQNLNCSKRRSQTSEALEAAIALNKPVSYFLTPTEVEEWLRWWFKSFKLISGSDPIWWIQW